eukprot:TRINITY_DN906_c0_g1_i1.p1 TRINITY_DN906_c0_g1~~TRINITY_DN906_c0_g1_i1.p1  ORF type:complete len:179 (-),score=16.73 TRINITY_DN906_c0_g1_i1:90-569(-)
MAQIQVGQTLPNATFLVLKDDAPSPITSADAFKGKVVIFGLPGAFTPTCSKDHCPGFARSAQRLTDKGVDKVICTATNDAYVLEAWAEAQNAKGKITFLADGNGEFARAVGLTLDTGAFGGVRSARYAIYAEDGVVKYVGVDKEGLDKSSADAVLAHLN